MRAWAGDHWTAVTGLVLVFGGLSFARLGWAGLTRRRPDSEPGRELRAPPMSSPAWKIVWAFGFLFGAFVAVCGLLLVLSVFLSE